MFGFFAMPYQCFAKPLSSHSQEHSNQARKFVVSRICHGRRSFLLQTRLALARDLGSFSCSFWAWSQESYHHNSSYINVVNSCEFCCICHVGSTAYGDHLWPVFSHVKGLHFPSRERAGCGTWTRIYICIRWYNLLPLHATKTAHSNLLDFRFISKENCKLWPNCRANTSTNQKQSWTQKACRQLP